MEEASSAEPVSEKPSDMPAAPASPKNRAHSDQPKAARVPIETSVSMFAARWRRLIAATRWNGQPPQTTTGAARVSVSHCQLSNWSAGIIDRAMTGAARTSEPTVRWRRERSSASSVSGSASASGASEATGAAP